MKIDFIVVTQFREHYKNRRGKTMKDDKDRTQSEHIRIALYPKSGTISVMHL
jgi:hypothetical protein